MRTPVDSSTLSAVRPTTRAANMGVSSSSPEMYCMQVLAWRLSAATTGSVPTSPTDRTSA
jgi:hypothetical protein